MALRICERFSTLISSQQRQYTQLPCASRNVIIPAFHTADTFGVKGCRFDQLGRRSTDRTFHRSGLQFGKSLNALGLNCGRTAVRSMRYIPFQARNPSPSSRHSTSIRFCFARTQGNCRSVMRATLLERRHVGRGSSGISKSYPLPRATGARSLVLPQGLGMAKFGEVILLPCQFCERFEPMFQRRISRIDRAPSIVSE